MTASFGVALRVAREGRGLSLSGLSRLVHYSTGYLSKVETGKARPNAALARRCDEALGTGGELGRLVPAEPPRRPAGRVTEVRVPPAPPRPFDLPTAPAHFTGRDRELELVLRLLGPGRSPWPGGVPIVLLHGMGGVGKTALAVHVAHRLREAYPDGCLFLRLGRTPDRTAVPAADALDIMLRRLGVPGAAIPAGEDDRSALLHGVLRDRKVLVVLDDARRADQVRPLLPAADGCAVLVTSRRRLVALDDAEPVRVEPLPVAAAGALFRSVAGLTGPELGARVDEVVRSCGLLPLTVRIAAAGQRGGTRDDLAELARRLADSRTRLAELNDGERSATAVFETSCADLPAGRRRLLALLTLQPGPAVSAHPAAWLADTDAAGSRQELRRLTEDNLLLPGDRGRHQLHDLTRAYAGDVLLAAVPPAEREAALRRLVTGYLATVAEAEGQLTPHRHRPAVEPHEAVAPPLRFADARAAAGWLEAEQDALVGACRVAAAHGWDAACWQLAYLLRGWFFLAKAWGPWLETHRLALAAARRHGDDWAIAVTRNNLGLVLVERGDLAAGREQYAQALQVFRRLDDRKGEANTLGHQAWVDYCAGRDESAARLGHRALELYDEQGAPRGAGITLRTLAMAHTRLGHHDQAGRHLLRALVLFDELDLPLDATMTMINLATLEAARGDLRAAVDWFRRAMEQADDCGSDYEKARAYDGLSVCAETAGLHRAAREFADRSRSLYDGLHVPPTERRRAAPLPAVTQPVR